jgi:hypothetical protein
VKSRARTSVGAAALAAGAIAMLLAAGCFDENGTGTCNCDSSPPTISITYPADGDTVSGVLTVTADVSDDTGIDRVQFYIDAQTADDATDFTAPFSYDWDTDTYPAKAYPAHTILAKAYDLAGNVGTSGMIEVVLGCRFNLSDFDGILETDEVGAILGGDPDDWCLDPGGEPPTQIAFGPAYPNPATGQAAISYALPTGEPAGAVSIKIVDGECGVVRTLVEGAQPAGMHTVVWDLRDENGDVVEPGLYRAIFTKSSFECHGDIEVQ